MYDFFINRNIVVSYNISETGCIFCNNQGFSLNTRKTIVTIKEQIEQSIAGLKKRYKTSRFMAYFQAYTNTYAPVNELKKIYDTIKDFPEIIGLSIGTRPDCVNEDILQLIDSYTQNYEVWIEYGLQSIHKKTLELINRGHVYEDFLKAVELTRKYKKINICAHVIIGLPYETREMIIQTAKATGSLKLDGIKIHPMHIVKDTELENIYKQGKYKPLELNEYIDLATNFLEYMWPNTTIQRITADCPKDLLISPEWILNKNKVLQGIEKKLIGKNTFQGKLY